MKFKEIFKKRKVEKGLSKYTVDELESLKAIYERQLEEFDSPTSYDVSDAKLNSDYCTRSFENNGYIKNQIKRDLADVIAELHKRKSCSEKEPGMD